MIAAKENPFRISRIRALGYIQQETSLPQLCKRLEQLDYTAAIIGPHGSGKTTLLRELEKRIRQLDTPTQQLFLNLDTNLPWQTVQQCINTTPPGGILFFDGACHLSFIRFRQLRHLSRKRGIGLVITSHHKGPLPTLIRCTPRLELLEKLTERLLPQDQMIRRTHLLDLFQLHKGNIRDCLWQLYDEYADRRRSRDIVMAR